MEESVIITITEHRLLGHVFLPYLVKKNTGKDYYTIKSRLQQEDIEKAPERFTDGEKEILKITDSYSDQELYRVFSKKKISVHHFQSTLTDEFLNKNIKPYIERRMVKCIDILIRYKLPLFLKILTDTIHEADRIILHATPAEAVFNFSLQDEGVNYHLSIKHSGKSFPLHKKNGIILSDKPCRLVLENDLFVFNDIDGKKLMPFFKKDSIYIPKSKEKEFMRVFVSRAIRQYEVNISGFEVKSAPSKASAKLILEEDLSLKPALNLKINYASIETSGEKTKGERVFLEEKDSRFVFYKQEKDKDFETKTLNFLERNGLVKESTGYYTLQGLNDRSIPEDNRNIEIRFQLLQWASKHMDALRQAGIAFGQNSSATNYFIGNPRLDMQVYEKTDWFDVHAYVYFDDIKIPFHRFFKNIREKERRFVLPNDVVAILPLEWFSTYKNFASFALTEKENIKLKKHHAGLLPETESNSAFLKKFKGIDTRQMSDITLPRRLKAALRPYQTQGYQWMKLLQEYNFGACLADDMGLGKTLQTISLLQKLYEDIPAGKKKKPAANTQLSLFDTAPVINTSATQPASLVVLPSSLIHNWKHELYKFAPELRVYEHCGARRIQKPDLFDQYQVVLTTYGVVRNDADLLARYPFLFLILDESQVIKNPKSKSYAAVDALNARHRIVLTGTPVENSLNDLWSQLNFLNKGMLGSFSFFQKEFVVPIEKGNDEHASENLKNIIRPFILRRTKSEVASDLPDLTENVVFCDMTDEQQKFYEKEKARIRNFLLESLRSKAVNEMRIMVFAALMRLRQISNHPRLVEDGFEGGSGKFEEVIRNLETILSGKHKILIFSSFVKHLNLFEQYFQDNNIKYSKLTGATKNREAVVNAFQNEPDNQVFLISIKAGGVGLNLTAAEYVFVLDPWWNPAVENQAINRAHRIGQNKHVFVYKFISKDTIEEKITGLQKRKAKLAGDFIDNNNPLAQLENEEVLALFS